MSEPVYRDLSHKPRLNLLRELTKRSQKDKTSPGQGEDQLTAAVAWLVDRSPKFADELCKLILCPRDDDARKALPPLDAEEPDRLRARVWVPLPPLSTKRKELRPDLSISAPNRSFQLLVEVKLGAAFGDDYEIPGFDRPGLQTEAYLYSWHKKCDRDQEAKERRLGTITITGNRPHGKTRAGKEFGEAPDPPTWRARDVTWEHVHTLLEKLLPSQAEPAPETKLKQEVRLVAKDLCSYIGDWVLPPEVPSGFDDKMEHFLRWGCTITREVCERLALVTGGKAKGAGRRYIGSLTKEDYYAICWLHLADPDNPEGKPAKLRFRVIPKYGPVNALGAEACFEIASDAGDVRRGDITKSAQERLEKSAGFAWQWGRHKEDSLRKSVPLDQITTLDKDDQIVYVTKWAEDLLRRAAFVVDVQGVSRG